MSWRRVAGVLRAHLPGVVVHGRQARGLVTSMMMDAVDALRDDHRWSSGGEFRVNVWACSECGAEVTTDKWSRRGELPSVSEMERLGVSPSCGEEAAKRVLGS